MTFSRPRPLRLCTGLACALLAAGCGEVTFDNPGGPGPGDSTGTAKVAITNSMQQDPGQLIFYLFAPESPSPQNGTRVKTLGTVAEGATNVLQAPSGTWKLAYEDEGGDLRPMTDTLETEAVWPRVRLGKGSAHSIRIVTRGNLTVWEYEHSLLAP